MSIQAFSDSVDPKLLKSGSQDQLWGPRWAGYEYIGKHVITSLNRNSRINNRATIEINSLT